MTRYTNVALKRSYVEAGFNYREAEEDSNEAGPSTAVPDASTSALTLENVSEPTSSGPKRKCNRKKAKKEGTGEAEGVDAGHGRTDNREEAAVGEGGEGAEVGESSTKKPKFSQTKAAKGKSKLKQKTLKGKEARQAASEQRRLRRQDERAADTVCYACREKGHAARNCPKALASDALASDRKGKQKLGKQAVGICYRCGSRKHNLSKCKKAVDPENPLPFSSCFVCSKQGHLASSCPENQSKGIYPNGGCCKLCKETSHLAKDCPMRKPEAVSVSNFVGTGVEAGADEDDFHIFRRKNMEITKEEKADERLKKQQAIKVGMHSGVVKVFGGAAPKPRKVINF